jgi:hypothetical protein
MSLKFTLANGKIFFPTNSLSIDRQVGYSHFLTVVGVVSMNLGGRHELLISFPLPVFSDEGWLYLNVRLLLIF